MFVTAVVRIDCPFIPSAGAQAMAYHRSPAEPYDEARISNLSLHAFIDFKVLRSLKGTSLRPNLQQKH